MTYRIRIVRLETNPQYEEQVAAAEQRRNMYGQYQDLTPQREREVACLETEISEREWEIVKRALLTHWEATTA